MCDYVYAAHDSSQALHCHRILPSYCLNLGSEFTTSFPYPIKAENSFYGYMVFENPTTFSAKIKRMYAVYFLESEMREEAYSKSPYEIRPTT